MRSTGCIALLVAAAVLATAAPARPATIAGDARLVTLKNGLQVLLAPDTSATAVDVAVWYPAGPGRERAGTTGVSHLLEHLLFRGSAHHGPQEHSRLVQAEGGAANAYTVADYACTYQTVPRPALDLVLQLEADRMGALRLTADGLAAEKRVLREERRWGVDAGPRAAALARLSALAWAGHPYRWPVLGLPEDVERITLADCQAWYESRYAPNGALVTIVGDFDPQEALRSAERWLAPLPRRKVPKDVPAPPPAQKAERRAAERAEVPVPMLAVAWRAPGRPDADAPALRLLSRILAGGPQARLQRALVQGATGCLSVECSLDARREAGLLYVLVAARPDADSAAVESTLVAEMDQLARTPVDDDELARARRQEQTAQLFAWQTARGRAESLGAAQVEDGDFHAADAQFERLGQVTAADLQRVAARLLVASGRSVLWLRPADAGAGPPGDGGSDSGAAGSPVEGGR